jgi:hypothetical protein
VSRPKNGSFTDTSSSLAEVIAGMVEISIIDVMTMAIDLEPI